MSVQLEEIRNLLLPGLMEIRGSYTTWPGAWEGMFANPVADDLVLPPLSPQLVLAMGAAAAVIKNPTVSRRFLDWFK